MKLNFGSGKDRIKEKDWINADIQEAEDIISFDFNKFPYPFKENTFEEIRAWYILEHLEDIDSVLNELWRISKDKCKIDFIIPYYNSQPAVNCAGHTHFFSDTTVRNMLLIDNPYKIDNALKFKLIFMELLTSKFWTWIPQSFRASIGKYFPNIINTIHFQVEVIKELTSPKTIKPLN